MPNLTLTPLYTPDQRTAEQSLLKQYMNWLFVKKGLYFRDYDDLWDWSVTDLEDFWESIWQFFDVQSYTPYHEVVQKPAQGAMIGTEWFTGATLNYAEHIFRHRHPHRPALLFTSSRPSGREMFRTTTDQHPLMTVSWPELEQQVAAVATYLRRLGVGVGDRVVAVLPNIPEAVVAFLATSAIGAVWSICSPDGSTASLIDRFQPLEPRVLFAVDEYANDGNRTDTTEAIRELCNNLPTLRQVIRVSCANSTYIPERANTRLDTPWHDVLNTPTPEGLLFEPVPFSHPIWVLYSSGTAGKPNAITHSVGGCLLEHLKVLALHQDVHVGETYCWHASTGELPWTMTLGSLLVGATPVLYDGAAAYPDLHTLWNLIEQARINHFGASAAYFMACQKAGIDLINTHKLASLRTIISTGSPLPPEGFRWVYESVKKNVWLISFSSSIGVCSGFMGGNPLLPVYANEVQCRLLGCKVDAFDEQGQPVRGKAGELVVLEPMPSMPLYVWNDRSEQLTNAQPPHHKRYRQRYFEKYPAIWHQGDYICITDRNSIIIYGRSDATLNRNGGRIGTSEVYSVVERFPEITDSLVVGLEQPGGDYFVPLFVVLADGFALTDALILRIRETLLNRFGPHHVPDAVYAVMAIPYTLNDKKLETPVRKILAGMDASLAVSRGILRNLVALDQFTGFSIEH